MLIAKEKPMARQHISTEYFPGLYINVPTSRNVRCSITAMHNTLGTYVIAIWNAW